MAVIGTLIFLDKNSGRKTPVYYGVQMEQSQRVHKPVRLLPVQQHHADGSAATILTFLPDGDRILLWPSETSKLGQNTGLLRVDPTNRKPKRVLQPFDGTESVPFNNVVALWSPDNRYAVFLNDYVVGDRGFWGGIPYLFDLRHNLLTRLPLNLGGFFWHCYSNKSEFLYLICQTLYGLERDRFGNVDYDAGMYVHPVILYDREDGWPFVPLYCRIRITEQGKPLPPESLSAQAVDRLVGSTYRIMPQHREKRSYTLRSSILLSPNGQTSLEYGLLNRYKDTANAPAPKPPTQGFNLPDPLTSKDRWMYRIFHDGRLLRTVSVPPDQYIYPLQWTADSRYLIGQRGYNDGIYNPDDTVVLIEPLSWQVKPLYQPPGKWKLVAFQEKPVAR